MLKYWIWTAVVGVFTYLFVRFIRIKNRFKKLGIPEVPLSYSFTSNVFFRKHANTIAREIYYINKDAKYIGCYVFFAPTIVIRDLDLVKNVLVKNFDNFANQTPIIKDSNDPLLAKNLAFINGNKWREVRNLLTPAFTSSKMKSMYVLMSNCAENFTQTFIEQYVDKEEIDMKDIFTRYANDVIATCAFGIEIDSLKNPKNEFYLRGKSSTNFAGVQMIKFLFLRILPTLSDKLGIRIISKSDTDFFVKVIQETIKERDEKGYTRPDMLQLMMDARNETSKKVNLDILEITAQAFIFFLGGFETTSTQICFIAHELATHPDIQLRLQAEIDEVMKDTSGKPTYEAVNNMVYLDAIFSEVLRIHSMSFVFRECSKEFELPPALPDGEPVSVKPGMEIMVPVAGIHFDPDYYQDPEKFDPERYLGKKAVISDVTSMGFGIGPRMCIGNRFAVLETKVLLVYLLSKCSLMPCKKTPIPIEYDLNNFSPTSKHGFWLKIRARH